MGNASGALMPPSDWLLVNSDFDIKLFNKRRFDELLDLYTKYQNGNKHKLYTPNYHRMSTRNGTSYNIVGSWEYYRDITSNITQNPCFSDIPKQQYFIFAQFYPNTTENNIIPNKLRLSLLSNLTKLLRDETLKYDIRDGTNGHYLYYKTLKFGIPDIYTKFEHNKWLEPDDKYDKFGDIDLDDDPFGIDSDSDHKNAKNDKNEIIQNIINMKYVEKHNMYMYDSDDKNTNTSFIHDLIDPNKHLNNSRLWIPTLFDCKYKCNINNFETDILKIIKSPILNLDFVKYKALYCDIAKIFKLLIQPMFENILNYNLGSNEKVIIKSMKYILQKPGDIYKGNIHREGMGEKILAVAVYYPQVSDKESGMKGGALKLQIPEICNSFLKCHTLEIQQGSCVAFSNEGYHHLPLIEYDENSENNAPISRTIVAFFLVTKHNSEDVLASNEKKLFVNLDFYWIYYINNWLRKYDLAQLNNYNWMMDIIFMYLFEANYQDYVYYRRYKMRKEKGKPLHDRLRNIFFESNFMRNCEEMPMNFGNRRNFT